MFNNLLNRNRSKSKFKDKLFKLNYLINFK